MSQRFSLADLSPEHQAQVRAQIGQTPAADIGIKSARGRDIRVRSLTYTADDPRGTSRRKYGNEPIEVDGHRFDSKWEAQRYRELSNQVDAGLITDLRLQVEYSLDVWTPTGPVRVAAYVADFDYRRALEKVVEDCKSAATKKNPVYVLKRAMFEAQYGIRITEVERRRRHA